MRAMLTRRSSGGRTLGKGTGPGIRHPHGPGDPGHSSLRVPTYKVSEVPCTADFQTWQSIRIPWGLVEWKF